MRKLFFLTPLICAHFFSAAQNVGIGTASPAAKLQVNHRSSTSAGLALVDSADNFGGQLEFRNTNNTKRMVVAGYAASNFNNGQFLDVRSDSVYTATFKGNGNIGVRNLDPQHPLDVAGDINTTGNLRANGIAGASGQVLQSNGNGTMSWVDMCEYKYYETFRTAGSSTWTVPAGVTKICIELWGGGGGGAIHGGGGGGGYIKAYFPVTPGATVSYTIGTGGTGGSFAGSSGNTGGTSTATVGSITINAFGGDGAGFTGIAGDLPGIGGGFSTTALFRNYIGSYGEKGSFNQTTYQQKNATTFVVFTKYGNGGNAGNTYNTGGVGNYTIVNEATAAVLKESYALAPHIPGGGGGSFYCTICTSYPGAAGQIIFHY